METEKKEYRVVLPVPMYHNDYNIWSVLKNCIGKELSKITMPVVFNEPLSFLQRMAEYMEYSHLLRIAAEQKDPIARMQFVIGFAVSALASNWERLGKPFNPLLGETYELEREEFKIICEQVSHHPPVSAFHAEGDTWVFHGSIHPKLKFWGKSVEIQPKGTVTVEFPKNEMIAIYCQQNSNGRAFKREYLRRYPNRLQPYNHQRLTFQNLFRNLGETGSFRPKGDNLGRLRLITPDQDDEIMVRVTDDREVSTRPLSAALRISKASILRTLHAEKYNPFHFTPLQYLLSADFPLRLNEAYTWSNVQCCVHNIIVGKLWMEQCGTMEILNHSTGHKAHLTFKPAGWNSKDLHRVEGYVADKTKRKLYFIYGKWTEFIKCTDYQSYEDYVKENAHKFKKDNDTKAKSPNDSPSHTSKKMLQKLNSLKVSPFKSNSTQESLDESSPSDLTEPAVPKSDSTYSIDIPNSTTIWKVNPRPMQSGDFYQFTEFAMSLNELERGMDENLCPTDSRLRPDIRKLEQGDIDGAAIEKTRLEEKQREANKHRKSKKGTDWSPRWFKQGINPHTKQEDWLYTGDYWKRQYTENPDIF